MPAVASRKFQYFFSALAACAGLAGCQAAMEGTPPAGEVAAAQVLPTIVDGTAMRNVDAPGNVGDWMSYSRDWGEQRFSPLTQINADNVGRLGLAWFDDLQT